MNFLFEIMEARRIKHFSIARQKELLPTNSIVEKLFFRTKGESRHSQKRKARKICC